MYYDAPSLMGLLLIHTIDILEIMDATVICKIHTHTHTIVDTHPCTYIHVHIHAIYIYINSDFQQ